ncbi:hypothetical protein D3C71_1990160 [compost metagenome]
MAIPADREAGAMESPQVTVRVAVNVNLTLAVRRERQIAEAVGGALKAVNLKAQILKIERNFTSI